MPQFIQISICIIISFWLSACGMMFAANNPEELKRTYNQAIVAIPPNYYGAKALKTMVYLAPSQRMQEIKQDIAEILAEKKIPLVIYLHGCAGFSRTSEHDIHFLVRNGYAVIAPDSFARNYRPQRCNTSTYDAYLTSGVVTYRLAEANYAYKEAYNLPWIDKQNIFLMGFSEGGKGVANYSQGGLAGRIILGWTCNAGWGEDGGVFGPDNEPIFAAVASKDPWYTHFTNVGDCGRFGKNIESIVVDSSRHDVQTLPEIKEKILKFLKGHKRP